MGERERYDFAEVERRSQARWKRAGVFVAPVPPTGRTCYVATSPPFTTGKAHMGHVRNLSMSDAHARYRRARGDSVLFTLGYDAFGLPNELAAIRRKERPRDWVERCRSSMTEQFERLGFSFDWTRTFLSCDDSIYRWSQWVFLRFLELGLIYRGEGIVDWCDSCATSLARMQVEGGKCWRCDGPVRARACVQWYLRIAPYLEELEDGVRHLVGWNRAGVASQRRVLKRVEGVELEGRLPNGAVLAAFTAHPEALAGAAFVAVSPGCAEIASLLDETKHRELRAALYEPALIEGARSPRTAPVVDSGLRVHFAALRGELPLIVTPLADHRAGAGAVLGIPEADPADAILAERMDIARPTNGHGDASAGARSTSRYLHRDFPISRQRSWGTPIPVVHCDLCGVVPVPESDLPVLLPEDIVPSGEGNSLEAHPTFKSCVCPRCSVPARRDTDTLDCHFDSLWILLAACVPARDRKTAMFDHPELALWMPVSQLYCGVDMGTYCMNDRFFSKALRDCGYLRSLRDSEPLAGVYMHELVLLDGAKMSKHLGNTIEPDRLVEEVGADALRMAILSAASPSRTIHWSQGHLARSSQFLEQLWEFFDTRRPLFASVPAGHRGRIGGKSRPRRRLRRWLETAVRMMTAAYESHAYHHVVRHGTGFLEQILRFESEALVCGSDREQADREALVGASRTLLQLLSPVIPHVTEELWAKSGQEGLLAATPWPEVVERERRSKDGRPGRGPADARTEAFDR